MISAWAKRETIKPTDALCSCAELFEQSRYDVTNSTWPATACQNPSLNPGGGVLRQAFVYSLCSFASFFKFLMSPLFREWYDTNLIQPSLSLEPNVMQLRVFCNERVDCQPKQTICYEALKLTTRKKQNTIHFEYNSFVERSIIQFEESHVM